MKRILLMFLMAMWPLLMSFAHKFYVSIYQVDFAPGKKRLEITSRIFVDDLNAALELKYGRKAWFGEADESASDIDLLKKYMASHFIVRVNGKQRHLEYMGRDYESNVLICYFRATGIEKVKSVEIRNTALTDYVTDQQNIIHTAVYGKKKSVILTIDNPVERLDY